MDAGKVSLLNGNITDIEYKDNVFIAKVSGLKTQLNKTIGDVYSPLCRCGFCSDKCKQKYRQQFLDRMITTGKNYAYLKIGEGCSNRCTYCAIPYIRGPFVSRKIEEILDMNISEKNKKGFKELLHATEKHYNIWQRQGFSGNV